MYLRDALDDELFGFLGDAEAFERIVLAELRLDALLAGREAGADLSAIAPRCAITHGLGLQDDDLVAGFGKLQRRGKAGITRRR